ncbi:MAG: AraC family transcriptional regulator ligand-binding domain-containing protein [Bermanella sp.]
MVANIIESYGGNSQAIFTSAGVSLDDLRRNNARIANPKLNEIWLKAQALIKDPYISLRLAKTIKPSVLDTLGISLSVSQHVYDALKRLERFAKYINSGREVIIKGCEEEVVVQVQRSPEDVCEISGVNIETLMSSMFYLLRSMAGDRFKVKGVYFQHEFFHDKKPFEDFFKCAVYFSSEFDQIVFEKQGLYDEVDFSNSVLTSTLDHWIEEYLSKFNVELISYKIQDYLLKHLAFNDIDQTNVADYLKISPRILRRKLTEEGVSYTELLDACRQKLAFNLISDSSISLSRLSSVLGFCDQSNFSRAFKRWSGSTPLQYRNNKLKCRK